MYQKFASMLRVGVCRVSHPVPPGRRRAVRTDAITGNSQGTLRRSLSYFRPFRALTSGLVAMMFSLALPATAATPPGTLINNQAAASFTTVAGTPVTVDSNIVTVTTVFGRTPSSAVFSRLAPAGGTLNETLGPAQCERNGVFAPLPAPIGLDGQPIDTAIAQPAIATGVYNANETAFVRLDDGDQNLDPLRRETVEVTVSNDVTGDRETLLLLETELNSGVFTGYIQLSDAAAAVGNCTLESDRDSNLAIEYTDPADNLDVSQALALVEPLAIVFDATTGLPVDGATITLIDNATGLPAVVFGNDGVSAYPSTVVSGAPATDASGLVYTVPVGGFRFPAVDPGNYRLQIVPPPQYIAPSNRSIDELNSLPGGPFDLTAASFGNVFTQLIAGATALSDVPLDPFDGGLFLTKRTSTTTAAVGDYVRYELSLQNASERVPATGVELRDTPPAGFRYVAGSARLDDVAVADPVFANTAGNDFTFALPDLAPAATARLTYVMEVTGGARGQRAINTANASANLGVVSNEASVGIRLREDLFRSRSTLIGRVLEADCTDETFSEEAGVQGVRVYLEDGRYAVTDEGGRFHMEGLTPGQRVAQLDGLTIPDWLELAACEDAPRFGGKANSQWVDLKPGLLHRADFYLKRKAPNAGSVALELINASGRAPDSIDYQVLLKGNGNVDLADLSTTVLLPKQAALIPGSARINGKQLSSLRSTGNALVFVHGPRKGEWQDTVTFSASIDPAYAGELLTKAVANFNTPQAKNQRTPIGEARMIREAATSENADYVLSLNFEVLSAELSVDDREILDALIDRWSGVYDIDINATGHTDADRIAARNRHVFADNYALSQARASAAARYLASGLSVPEQNITVRGLGADRPVASNDSDEGKRRNRRVELLMTGIRPGRQSVVEVTQEASGVQRVDTIGGIPGPGSDVDALDQKISEINAIGESNNRQATLSVDSLPVAIGFVSPAAGFEPAIPSLTVGIAHPGGTRIELELNGRPVSKLNFDGVEQDASKTQALSRWRGVDLANGDNTLIARVIDADGNLIQQLKRSVHYAGQPIRGEFIKDQSRLVADGRKRPVIAVKLVDADGSPARAATVGGFSIDSPYRSWFEVSQERENKLVSINQREPFYRVGPGGIAYIELEPTTRAGEVTLRLAFENQREQEIRAYLSPAPRDWILVGFAEGTVGYNTIKDNLQSAEAAGAEEDLYTDGRVALFAKGRIKGDYLLTLAYDTRGSNVDRDRFDTEVNPDEYFTLYGDGTESRFEAASQRKLYVKLERRQFVALFGDYDTGMSVTELARYERRFNGIQAQYFGERFSYNAFAAETDQAFQRDDIPGDGTSGLYRLSSRDIIVNSDQVRIETRDRFDASQVIETRTLTRFVDYDIDYFAGTLFFKRPIASRDQNLNPLVIVAEYEAREAAQDDLVAGGRAAVKFLDDDLEFGVSAVREENVVDANTLLGVDLRWQMNNETLLRAEYADTDRDDLSATTSGYAYKIELEHRSGTLDARVFHELADSGFGLGQQAANQVGVESTGIEARWRHAERWFTQTLLGYQKNLDTGTERKLAEAELRYEDQRNTAFVGLSLVTDEAIDGTERESQLLRAGVGRKFANDKLTLRASTEQPLGGNDGSVDFPARTLVGIDWNLSNATLFAEHEFAEGANIEAQTSRVGLRATPWQRAQFNTTLDNQITEFGPRLFANIGLVQGWQVSERWTVDVGVDHSNTLIDDRALIFDPDRELASGSLRSDFVAGYVGALFQSDYWSANGRVEQRAADDEDRNTVVLGWFREPVAGHGFSAGVQYLDSDRFVNGSETRGDIRMGWAYRKADRRWSFLDRLDLILDETSGPAGQTRTVRYINNFNAVRRLGPGSELSLQYAAKYVRSEFDGIAYSGYTDLMGADYRQSFRPRWDFGLHASVLHSWESDVVDFGLGADIGFNPRDNVWLSFGYNVLGFRDPDFDNARYTASGPYFNITIKADQHTLKEIAGRIRNPR